jgi:predicted XRE-type DNA-binding protein
MMLSAQVMNVKISPSSGNVFADLGFGEEEAEHLRIRSMLMIEVRKLIEERGLMQGRAAELTGVTQPCISDLMHSKTEIFSAHGLIDALAHAGAHVDAVFSPTCNQQDFRDPCQESEPGDTNAKT